MTYPTKMKAPSKFSDKPLELSGKFMFLPVGDVPCGVFIHKKGRAKLLSHYETGYLLGDLEDVRRDNAGAKRSDKAAAKVLLEGLVSRYGISRVLAVMASTPVVNPLGSAAPIQPRQRA